VLLSLLTGAAHAKSWLKLAPPPLASDSSFAALSAMPADSLDASVREWLVVQRNWRAQRAWDDAPAPTGISEFPGPAGTAPVLRIRHLSRHSDARFAELASRPYAALADSDRAWLSRESERQRDALVTHLEARSGNGGVYLLAGLLLGAVGGGLALVSALGHAAIW